MRLSELTNGDRAIIVKVNGSGHFRRRMLEMGFVRGREIEILRNAPLSDPIRYRLMGYELSLRKVEAFQIEVMTKESVREFEKSFTQVTFTEETLRELVEEKGKEIVVCILGNPNSGKTTLFNVLTGANEHVGNYSGVTVEANEKEFFYKGYRIRLIDLPGAYSLSSVTPKDLYVRQFIDQNHPDIIINLVDASNLERNLYLTTQLIDMDIRMVIALSMWDSLVKQNQQLDYDHLGRMIGVPIIPLDSFRDESLNQLMGSVVKVFESNDPIVRHIHIHHGQVLEDAIKSIQSKLKTNAELRSYFSIRYLAIKLLEGDTETEKQLQSYFPDKRLHELRDQLATEIKEALNEDAPSAISNAKYGFISGALLETYQGSEIDTSVVTRSIDSVVTNRYLGYPIFLLIMYLMFNGAFSLGAYPMQWLSSLFGWMAETVNATMAEGPLRSLLVDGIINGVGGLIVFVPNIILLYLFISLMEDSGYMARAVFILDKVMHRIGLHGKSFISLIMGFGCNVPAVMSTKGIENRNSRLITMMIIPLMSCSARLPVYLTIAGAFFPNNSATVLFALYLLGVVISVIMAKLFKRYLFNEEEVPFVMELPPYRMPVAKATVKHVWQKTQQYVINIYKVIMVASVLIWALSYYPNAGDHLTPQEQREQSYIGHIGKAFQPLLAPLGFDWKTSVALLSGVAGKEVIVSSLMVLYQGEGESVGDLSTRMRRDESIVGDDGFTPLTAFGFLVFVLFYFPCIATLTAIQKESGSWKWGLFALFYTTALAWSFAFVIYQFGRLF